MDSQRFDNLTRLLGTGTSRRRVLTMFGGGLLAAVAGRTTASAAPAKVPLCHVTGDPANPYTVIEVAEPAWEVHLGHGDTPYVDCCLDTDCQAGYTCEAGACTLSQWCPAPCEICPLDGLCRCFNCGERATWNSAACRCECKPEYVPLPGGSCGLPCTTSADCDGWRCEAILGGTQQVCASFGDFVHCPTCDDHEDCYVACSARSAYCRADGTCGAAV